MKRSPQDIRLEEILRSSKLVAGGFMGTDQRTPEEVIGADQAVLEQRGYTTQQIAEKMTQLHDLAKPQLGNSVIVENRFEVHYDDYKGSQPCPWPHPGRFDKGITICKRLDNQQMFMWSNLEIHLIEQHGFFQGKGSTYRLEPAELAAFLFEF